MDRNASVGWRRRWYPAPRGRFRHPTRWSERPADSQGRTYESACLRILFESPRSLRLAQRQNGIRRNPGAQMMQPPPASIPVRNPKRIKFLDIDPLEMARQLTLMDSRLYARIQPSECLSKAWPKALGPETPDITSMTALGNAVRFQVSSMKVMSIQRGTDHKLGRRDGPAARGSASSSEYDQALRSHRRGALAVLKLVFLELKIADRNVEHCRTFRRSFTSLPVCTRRQSIAYVEHGRRSTRGQWHR